MNWNIIETTLFGAMLLIFVGFTSLCISYIFVSILSMPRQRLLKFLAIFVGVSILCFGVGFAWGQLLAYLIEQGWVIS